MLYILYSEVIYKPFAYNGYVVAQEVGIMFEVMFESMPGGEPIILDKVPIMTYCGRCMEQMVCLHGHMFTCPLCGMSHEKKDAV